jgi:hypothetical protein
MLLFNQTNRALSWSFSGVKFACAAWESPVPDVPNEWVEACKRIGLPLSTTPVAPETRANKRVEEERVAASDDVVRQLNEQISEAKADADAARRELEKAHARLSDVVNQKRELEKSNEALSRKLESAEENRAAADALLSETAKQAELAETRAVKAEALLTEKKRK